jgi:hypothetical protein
MKVLEKGKWDMPWTAEVICTEKQCGAKLLVEEGDVCVVDYSSKNDFKVTCMVCGTTVYMSGKDIPLRVTRPLDQKRKYSSSDY